MENRIRGNQEKNADLKVLKQVAYDRVRTATLERSDMLSIGIELQHAVRLGQYIDPTNGVVPREIFSLVERYFNKKDGVWKTLYPDNMQDDVAMEQYQHIMKTFNKLPINEMPEAIRNYMEDIRKSINDLEEAKLKGGKYVNKVVFISREPDSRKSLQKDRYRYHYHGDIVTLCRTYDANQSMLQNPVAEKILSIAKAAHEDPHPGIQDIYIQKFGGVSLKDLHEKDDMHFVNSAMRFLAAVPRDDMLWKGVGLAIFYNFHVLMQPITDKKLDGKLSPIEKKLMQYQQFVTENLLYPVFLRDYENEDFDTKFKKIIEASSKEEQIAIGANLYAHISSANTISEHNLSDLGLRNDTTHPPIAELPLAGFRQSLLLKDEYFELDRMQAFLRNHDDSLASSLKARFGDSDAVQTIAHSFLTFSKELTEKNVNENVIRDTIGEIPPLGRALMRKASDDALAMDLTYETVNEYYDNETIRSLPFPQKLTVPNFGFSHVFIGIDPNDNQHYVRFYHADKNVSIVGVSEGKSVRMYPETVVDDEVTSYFKRLTHAFVAKETAKTEKPKITPQMANAIFTHVTKGEEHAE